MNFLTPEAPMTDRMAEILDAVKPVLIVKGFDTASMQDLARAAGMSAGNFYRYFPSKDDLVLALVHRDLDQAIGEFDLAMQSDGPLAAFREVLRKRMDAKTECSVRMWSAVEASCAHRPDMAALMVQTEISIRQRILTVFASISGLDQDEAARRFDGHARFLMLLIQGLGKSAFQARQAGDPPEAVASLRVLAERSLNSILDEVAAAAPSAVK